MANVDPPPSDAAGSDEQPGKWEELLDEWVDCTKAAMDRGAERARQNVKLARDGRYGLGAWLGDIAWFWAGVADDAAHLVNTVADTTRATPRPDPERRH